LTRLSISWNTGKKAAAMSTSCTVRYMCLYARRTYQLKTTNATTRSSGKTHRHSMVIPRAYFFSKCRK
jgi:hypothetical protein